MAEAVPAKSVVIEHRYRARCLIGGCGHAFTDWPSYQQANAQRLDHLEAHRQEARDGG